MNNQYY